MLPSASQCGTCSIRKTLRSLATALRHKDQDRAAQGQKLAPAPKRTLGPWVSKETYYTGKRDLRDLKWPLGRRRHQSCQGRRLATSCSQRAPSSFLFSQKDWRITKGVRKKLFDLNNTLYDMRQEGIILAVDCGPAGGAGFDSGGVNLPRPEPPPITCLVPRPSFGSCPESSGIQPWARLESRAYRARAERGPWHQAGVKGLLSCPRLHSDSVKS
jgi:hypothetical protein